MTTESSDGSLRHSFGGTLLEPAWPGYDEARRFHSGLIDKRPALIAQCRDTADISAAVKYARADGLEISVRGGGHNVAGRAVTSGGMMIDLSLMAGVTVDAAKKLAIAGLTPGGGLGWLMSLHGMAVDNLVAALIVRADGSVLTCSAEENQDLFWAVRGGGGYFGVAASLTFRLHPVSEVVSGIVAHPLDRGAEMLRFFRDTMAAVPDELSVFSGLRHAPDGSGDEIGAMIAFYADPVAGLEAVKPVRAFGPPIMDMVGPMPYARVNTMLDAGFPRGAPNYWKSSFLTTLTDAAIDTMVAAFRECPAPIGSLLLEHFHGAVTRVPVADTAFPHRATGYNFLLIAQWLEPAESDACIAGPRKTYAAMQPFFASGR